MVDIRSENKEVKNEIRNDLRLEFHCDAKVLGIAVDMQAAMAFKYIIDMGPLMGVPGAVSALRQFDHPHDIAIPALFR